MIYQVWQNLPRCCDAQSPRPPTVSISSDRPIQVIGELSWDIQTSTPPYTIGGLSKQDRLSRSLEYTATIGLRREAYGTHSMRRTKASMLSRATGNLRAVQILLGHSKIENTVRYLGVDIEDALLLAERTEI